MFLLTDFINPQGSTSIVTSLDKINHNIDLIKPLKESIEKQKTFRKEAFSSITICGIWLIVYQANVINDNETMMYIIDFRIDLVKSGISNVFSLNTMNNLIELQNKYDEVYEEKMDTVVLTLAEPFETVIKENLFACDNDEIVLSKAKSLEVLPMIETLKDGDKIKVVIADEKLEINDDQIINIYAIIHFGGHIEEIKHDNGFAYIKIYDLKNNFDLVQDFQDAIEEIGGKFDRLFFMERFGKHKLN